MKMYCDCMGRPTEHGLEDGGNRCRVCLNLKKPMATMATPTAPSLVVVSTEKDKGEIKPS